jgi:hypothetical protein
MFRTIRKKLFRLAIVSGAGAAANYFFDKDRGEQRRAQAKEKANSLIGKTSGGSSWQPQAEQAANGFEPHVVSTSSTPTTPASPSVSDVLAEPTVDDISGTSPGTTTAPRPVTS